MCRFCTDTTSRINLVLVRGLAVGAALVVGASISAPAVRAQAVRAQTVQTAIPASADSAATTTRRFVLARVRERLAQRDTVNRIVLLRGASADAPYDAAVWHEYGQLLSASTKAYWRKGFMPAGVPQKIILADSAFARAARRAPDSASYALHSADHLFASNPWNLTIALKVQASAIAGAERTNDSVPIALASEAVGLFLWRRYEPLVAHRFEMISLGFGWPDFVTEPSKFQEYIDDATKTWNPPLDDGLYVQAGEYFRRARILLPDSVLPFRHEAMLLASRLRWEELSALAKSRIAPRPGQMWPWLTMGIAPHRLGNGARAAAALDSGFARMSGSDRDRLMSRARLLPTGQAEMIRYVVRGRESPAPWRVLERRQPVDADRWQPRVRRVPHACRVRGTDVDERADLRARGGL